MELYGLGYEYEKYLQYRVEVESLKDFIVKIGMAEGLSDDSLSFVLEDLNLDLKENGFCVVRRNGEIYSYYPVIL